MSLSFSVIFIYYGVNQPLQLAPSILYFHFQFIGPETVDSCVIYTLTQDYSLVI